MKHIVEVVFLSLIFKNKKRKTNGLSNGSKLDTWIQ